MQHVSIVRAERATAKFSFAKINPVKLWVASTTFLVLSAALIPMAATSNSLAPKTGVEGSKSYGCTEGCMYNYQLCIRTPGQTYQACLSQYQLCQANCGGQL